MAFNNPSLGSSSMRHNAVHNEKLRNMLEEYAEDSYKYRNTELSEDFSITRESLDKFWKKKCIIFLTKYF